MSCDYCVLCLFLEVLWVGLHCVIVVFSGYTNILFVLVGWQIANNILTMTSVVPRARHCAVPAILPSMSLKNAPIAGLRGLKKKSADFLLFKPRFCI